jgi:hypothetical protein
MPYPSRSSAGFRNRQPSTSFLYGNQLVASELLQRDFLTKQPGFLHRELLKGADGVWVDLIHWESRDAVEQALRNAQASPVCHQYFALMVPTSPDDPSGGISLFEQVQRYR